MLFFLAQLKISLTTSIDAQTYVQYNTKRKKMDPSCRYQIGIKEAWVLQNVPRGYGYYWGIAACVPQAYPFFAKKKKNQ